MLDAERIRFQLKRGGVIAYLTESCHGRSCDPRNLAAGIRTLIINDTVSTQRRLSSIQDLFCGAVIRE